MFRIGFRGVPTIWSFNTTQLISSTVNFCYRFCDRLERLRNEVAVLLFLINGRISDGKLLSEPNFHVPAYGGRSRTTFYIPPLRSRASDLSTVRRPQKLYNEVSRGFRDWDPFHMSRKQYKTRVTEILQIVP